MSKEIFIQQCQRKLAKKMGKKYGWELIEVKQTERDILPVDCVFEGEQTSFWEMWNDHQE